VNNIVKVKYRIENEEIIYWIMFFVIVSIYALLSYIINKHYHIIYFIIVALFVPSVFMTYFLINRFQCKRFSIFCDEIRKNGIKITINECTIKIKRNEYHIKPVTQSMDVNIKTYFRTIKAYFIQTNDFFILFFQLPDLGLFRRYIRPVVFKKNTTAPTIFMKNVYLIETYEKKNEVENGICIKLNKKLDGIEYMILPNNSCL
jgi:hypothetical protein